MNKKSKLTTVFFLLCYFSPALAYDIKVLVNYTNSAEQRYPTKQKKAQSTNNSNIAIYLPQQCDKNGCLSPYSHSVPSGVYTRIIDLFNRANNTFQMSGVNINLLPVGFVNINQYPSTAGAFKTVQDPRKFKPYKYNSFRDREKYQADLISLFTVASKKLCGLGLQLEKQVDRATKTEFINGSDWVNYLWYTIIGIDCSSYSTLAHEVGHSLGLNHSQITGDKGTVYDYGVGYGSRSLFNTVMAYQSDYNSNLWLDMFSNPYTTCYSPLACGKAGIANSTRALNNIAYLASQLNERCKTSVQFNADKNSYKSTVSCMPAQFIITADYVN